jgi:hypothetical protein
MLSRLTAGLAAGVFALATTPAIAQVKEERKSDQAETVKRLQAELERLKAVEAELQAKLKSLSNENERRRAVESIEPKGRLDKEPIEKARNRLADEVKRAEMDKVLRLREALGREALQEIEKAHPVRDEHEKLAQVEREKVTRVRDEELQRAQVEQQRSARLQVERARDIQREIDRAIELKVAGQDKSRVLVLESGKVPVPYEKMSPQELKEVIVKLQMLLDEKVRAADKEKLGGEKIKPGAPDKPKPGSGERIKPGTVSQDEILKRLDKLTHEVEELKRAIRK